MLNVAIKFYVPSKHLIVAVVVHNCWRCFTKPQQANILSWFKEYLADHDILNHIQIPALLKKAATLVGAPLGSISHEEIGIIHQNEADYTIGFVYDEPKHQSLCLDVSAMMLEATHGISSELFFPACSNKNLLAYDCLTKTTNFLLSFPLFTKREQDIRHIMKQRQLRFKAAAIVKMRGGIQIECMRDFVVDENLAYSFDKLRSFNYLEMMREFKAQNPDAARTHKKRYCPADDVLAFVKDQMLTQGVHDKLLLVLKGNRIVELKHAL